MKKYTFISKILGNIFWRKENKQIGSIKLEGTDYRVVFPSEVNLDTNEFINPRALAPNSSHATFDTCSQGPSLTCAFEVLFALILAFLFAYEVFQLITLGARRYFSELENLLEVVIFTLALLGLIFQSDLYVMKWISAIGICLAYLELIFLLGKSIDVQRVW